MNKPVRGELEKALLKALRVNTIWGRIQDNFLSPVQKLIKENADVNATDIEGNPLLSMTLSTVIEDKNIEVKGRLVQMLLEAGADINAKDIEGNPPLSVALMEYYPSVVQILVDAGLKVDDAKLDVNATDLSGRTSLSHAVDKEDTYAVDALLEAGANVNAEDISLANSSKNSELKDLFQKKGYIEGGKRTMKRRSKKSKKNKKKSTKKRHSTRKTRKRRQKR
jgi:ankyrin repeat protein